MATVNSEYVQSKILTGYIYFQICEPDGKTVISEQNDNITPEHAAAMYAEAVNNIDGALIVILQTSNFTPGKGGLKRKGETLTIRTTGNKTRPHTSAPNNGGVDLNFILGMMREQTAKDIELAKLNLKIEQLENNAGDGVLGAIEKHKDLIYPIINGISSYFGNRRVPAPAPRPVRRPKVSEPQTPGETQTPGEPASQETTDEIISEENQIRLANLFADPDEAINRIAATLENEPERLEQIKAIFGLQ